MNRFSTLFKKYRLRSEFETLSQLGLALADKGYIYDESIFSHWQKGTRVPSRDILIKLIQIFVEHNAIRSIKEANEFLESAHHGFLTSKEKNALQFSQELDVPFQVPSEIAHFTGREDIVIKIKKELLKGKIVLLHGPPGVGKTALAIKLGHVLKSKFTDGVLWYKVDSTNVMDILLSIAHLFGEDISMIKDIEVRASAVRTLLAKRKLLLIFDNVSNQEQLHLLLSNSQNTSVIFSSQEHALKINTHYLSIPIDTFTQEESLELFKQVLGNTYVTKNKSSIKNLINTLGNLPLALNIVANYIKQSKTSIEKYQKKLNEESINLQTLTYEDKNLFKAITTIYDSLPPKSQTVFTSLGVFEGKDFSIEAVSYINKLPIPETEKTLETLKNISFIEQSKTERYRIHPVMRTFAREKIEDDSLYLRAASFYEQLLTSNYEKKSSKKALAQEVDNIIHIFKKCYDLGYWDQIITIWNPLERFLSEMNELKKLRLLAKTVDTAPKVNILQKIYICYMTLIFLFWIGLLINGSKAGVLNDLYQIFWSLIPLTGGFLGILLSRIWGLFRSHIGKAIFFISVGVFSWACGNVIWIYYNFMYDIEIPYPSLADIGYVLGGIFWIIGIIYLSLATGATFTLGHVPKKLYYFVLPLSLCALTLYFLVFIVERKYQSVSIIKTIFDYIYPALDIVILTLSLSIFSLSLNFFSGKYRLSLFSILFGFIFLFIADLGFSYATSAGLYYNGSFFEFLFNIALFLLTWGTLSFYLTPKQK